MQPATTHIAIAVVEHENLFLIGQRPPGVKLAGYWEFPGGKVEPHETAVEAAIRECLEETGLQVSVEREYLSQSFEYPHGNVWLMFFACRLIEASLMQPSSPFRWVLREQLAHYRFPDGNTALLTMLLQKE